MSKEEVMKGLQVIVDIFDFLTVLHLIRGSYEGSSIVIVDIFDFLTVLHLKRGSYEGSSIVIVDIFDFLTVLHLKRGSSNVIIAWICRRPHLQM
jgi:ribosomal protein L14E/L6E/L27E